jgi:hypothetical protein
MDLVDAKKSDVKCIFLKIVVDGILRVGYYLFIG